MDRVVRKGFFFITPTWLTGSDAGVKRIYSKRWREDELVHPYNNSIMIGADVHVGSV